MYILAVIDARGTGRHVDRTLGTAVAECAPAGVLKQSMAMHRSQCATAFWK
jgi:hypothetical protein